MSDVWTWITKLCLQKFNDCRTSGFLGCWLWRTNFNRWWSPLFTLWLKRLLFAHITKSMLCVVVTVNCWKLWISYFKRIIIRIITTACEWTWSVCRNHRRIIIRKHVCVSGELGAFIESVYFPSFNSHWKFLPNSAGNLFSEKLFHVTGNINQILQGTFSVKICHWSMQILWEGAIYFTQRYHITKFACCAVTFSYADMFLSLLCSCIWNYRLLKWGIWWGFSANFSQYASSRY